MAEFNAASKANLLTCHTTLQLIANKAILVQEHRILQGHRGQVEQDKAFAEGKSKLKWPNGNHNKMPSTALDMAPVYYEGTSIAKIDWADLAAFGRIAGIYQAIAHEFGVKLRFGLDWDGDFRSVGPDPTESFLDAPHIELLEGTP